MPTELERYCIIFDRLVRRTIEDVRATSESSQTWQPTLGTDVRFGERITDVTVKSLLIHLMVSEHLWIRALAHCDDGALVTSPISPELTARLSSGNNLAKAMAMHTENMDIVGKFSESTLAKKVTFAECSWTVMGFLWAIFGHHSYHFGHIDMYWRLSGAAGAEYHSFNPRQMA